MTVRWLWLLPCAFVLGGCHDMWEQPKYQPLQSSRLFDDGASARPLVQGVIAREAPRVLTPADTGLRATANQNISKNASSLSALPGRVPSPSASTTNPQYVEANPLPLTRVLLERGRDRYDINCSPCHGFDGYGRGIVIERGFPNPPSFHSDRLRNAPAGHFFDVITHGYGVMYSYADRVSPHDRWAIEAYIRALQRSQNATLADVPPDERTRLEPSP